MDSVSNQKLEFLHCVSFYDFLLCRVQSDSMKYDTVNAVVSRYELQPEKLTTAKKL